VNRQERRQQRKQQQKMASSTATMKLLDEATAHYTAGRLNEAAELCQDAIGTAPLDAEPYHLYALICYRQGRLEDAGENILEATTRNETNPELHANCGAIMNMLGRHMEAEAACRHVIDLNPKSAEAHSNLGVALEMQGRIEEAFEACRKALELNPEYPEALINLGNLHVRTTDYVSGVESFAEAIALAPENPTARTNLSVALLRLGETEAACEQAREALRINPRYVEALIALGNAEISTDGYEEAEEAFRSALEIHPNHPEAALNLAAALHKAGRSDASAIVYRDLLSVHTDLAEAEAGLGVVLLASGRLDEAIGAFRRAVVSKPTLGDAQYNLASAAGATLTDDEVTAMQTALNDEKLNPGDCISLHFAVAEAADKRGDPKTAIDHFNSGNSFRRDAFAQNEITFDAGEFDRSIDEIIETFNAEILSRFEGQGHASDTPVFIAGMPRSGTTLVEQIIASHPDASSVGERGLIERLPEGYPAGTLGLTPERMKELANQALAELTSRGNGTARVVEKTPFNFLYLGLIQILFPNARIIHCGRDPMDLGLSCYAQNFIADHPWSTDLGDIGRFIKAEAKLMKHWNTVLSTPVLHVQYENLIIDQEGETRRIIEHMGLEWNDSCLSFHNNDQTVLTASNWQVRKPIYTNSQGRAKAYGTSLDQLANALA